MFFWKTEKTVGNKTIFTEVCFFTFGMFVHGSCGTHSLNNAMQVEAWRPGVVNWLSKQHYKYCWRIAVLCEFMFVLRWNMLPKFISAHAVPWAIKKQQISFIYTHILETWFFPPQQETKNAITFPFYITNCPTGCNTKQSIYYSARSLYMFGCQQHPSSGVHKTVTTASGAGHIFCAAGLATVEGGSCTKSMTSSLYMFRVSATSINRSTQNFNYSLRYRWS